MINKDEAVLAVKSQTKEILAISISGSLNSFSCANIWKKLVNIYEKASPKKLIIDLEELNYCDMSGMALFYMLDSRQKSQNRTFEIKNIQSEFQNLFAVFENQKFELQDKKRHLNLIEKIGKFFIDFCRDIRDQISFVGESSTALLNTFINPGKIRWKDVLNVAEHTGIKALPIVMLIGFLMGLIMSFQSVIPMRQFGAEIFIADLIGLSMLRELGPLMTAIVLAGRSGSSFAAEIGTMKVNEEINALITMGIDPVRFLVVVRVIATIMVTPVLTIFADLIGIIGGSIPLVSLGYPAVIYYNEMLTMVDYVDFVSGLVKSLVFGLLVAGIGCLRGLQTQYGAKAVGESTTRSVVSGIILIVIFDGIFSVIFYYLDI